MDVLQLPPNSMSFAVSERWLVLDVRKLMEKTRKPGILAMIGRFLCDFSITAGLMFQ